MLHEVHSRTFASNVLRLCTKDEMQGAEDEVERSVLTYVTETNSDSNAADRLRATVSRCVTIKQSFNHEQKKYFPCKCGSSIRARVE